MLVTRSALRQISSLFWRHSSYDLWKPCIRRQHLRQKRKLATAAATLTFQTHQHMELDTSRFPKPPMINDSKIQIFSDTRGQYVNVPNIWLRDHCHCESCFHPVTKQRILETFDELESNVEIARDGISQTQDEIVVKWKDGHQSVFKKQWLSGAGVNRLLHASERQALVEPIYWDGESIKNNAPTADFEAVMSNDSALKDWLLNIRRYGFSYVDNCPVTPEASEKLLRRISFIRNTHYGGFYDFTADLSSGDTAYTQLGIGAHTDNTYFTDPAGLQMFHLLSHTNGTGGKSQLVDGFGAAKELHEQDPQAYETLATTPIHSHASGGEDISIQPQQAYPVLCRDPQQGFLVQVRWNTTDRAAIDLPLENMGAWYDAARKWATILRKREYWDQLRPGRPLIFDNWRVLHGRSAFTGNRRMCGGYINRDDWISRFRLLKDGRASVLQAVARG